MRVILDDRDKEMLENGEWAKFLDGDDRRDRHVVDNTEKVYDIRFKVKDINLCNMFIYDVLWPNMFKKTDGMEDNTGMEVISVGVNGNEVSKTKILEAINRLKLELVGD